jgi:hypothetical protein
VQFREELVEKQEADLQKRRDQVLAFNFGVINN